MRRHVLLRLLSLSTLAGATGCAGQSAPPGADFVPDVELVLTAAAKDEPHKKTELGLEEAHRDLKISPEEFDEVAAELGRTLAAAAL